MLLLSIACDTTRQGQEWAGTGTDHLSVERVLQVWKPRPCALVTFKQQEIRQGAHAPGKRYNHVTKREMH